MDYIVYEGIFIRWRINERAKSKIDLKSIPGVFLLNPLKYAQYYAEREIITVSFKYEGEVFAYTRGLIIGSHLSMELSDHKRREELSDLLRHARIISAQHDLDYKGTGVWSKASGPIKAKSIQVEEIKHFAMNEYNYWTDLKWSDVVQADVNKSKGVSYPIYKEVILDAFDAHFKNDYRKSVLYFALACETFVSTKLFERYEEQKRRKKLKTKQLDLSTGVTTDPVFELLTGQKWNFNNKLHEHCLYMFDKSLLVDDKKVYDGLIRLYKTRNKLVHQGEIQGVPGNPLFSLDFSGSDEVIGYAIALFKWLGEDYIKVFENRKFKVFNIVD